ncbi:hypothetical protein GJ744_005372 [Endocarpon pusillum]|uniref:Uncharacterized protein n=1 Tax=Endocarpon pusillum TaxID=364733 RepID=A0A8H7AQ52_9EURO|nr:hypothetical protein GJ744_005372 [Endocarpon pusillum]
MMANEEFIIKRKPLPDVSVQESPLDALLGQSHVSTNSDSINIHQGPSATSSNGDESSETDLEPENMPCNRKSAPSMWNPIWLSKTCLMSFATSFLVLALATVTIYVVSAKQAGLVTQTYSNRYSWTYGPTAVFVLLNGLWWQIDYWCKMIMPWHRMRKAATPADQSILRDYLSPISFSTMWMSFRSKDFAVLLSTLGSLLLQLTIIVSTGLIMLESTSVEKAGEVKLLTKFVSAAPNISALETTENALVRYHGIQSKNLPFPATTSANLTIQKLLPQDGSPANTSYTVDVEGMSANLKCEPLHLPNVTNRISLPWKSILAPCFSIDITTPSCNILGVPMGMGPDHMPPETDTTSSYQGWWGNYTCNDGIRNSEYPYLEDPSRSSKPIIPGFDDHRIVIITSLVQWTPYDRPEERRITWVQNFTAIMCKPTYSINTYSLTYSQQDIEKQEPFTAVKQAGNSAKVDKFTDDDLAPLLREIADQSGLIEAKQRDQVAVVSPDFGYVRPQDPWFLVMSEMCGDSGMAALMDGTTLLEVAPKVFSGAMAQIFNDYFTTPSEAKIAARFRTWENRLRVRGLPVALTTTFLGLMTCIALVLISLRPRHAVPLEPESILAKAKLLAASPALAAELLSVNWQSVDGIRQKLKGIVYQTVLATTENTPSFTVRPISHCRPEGISQEKPALPLSGCWRPMSQKMWFTLPTVLLPLAIIGALEGLQHASNSGQGLSDITTSGDQHILITLIPATVMSGTLLLFSSLHFGTSLIAPFHALRKGGVSLTKGLTVSLVGRSPPHSLYLTLKHRSFLPFLTVLTVVVGSFLTIVVSGLYFVENVPLTKEVPLQLVDSFNYTLNDLSKADNLASVTTSLIYYQNLSYPQWTYNNLVFPTLRFIEPLDALQNESSVVIQISAIRPTLECLLVSPAEMSYEDVINVSDSRISGSRPAVWSTYRATVDLPCLVNGTTMDCDFDLSFELVVPLEASDVVVGRILDYLPDYSCRGTPRKLDLPAGEDGSLQIGCPSLLYALGTTSTRLSNNSEVIQDKPDIHAFLCYKHLEEVQTRVTFDAIDLSISKRSPPVPLEETARKLNFTYSNYTGPVYRNSLATVEDALPHAKDSWCDSLMDAVIRGKGGIDVNTLTGKEGVPNLMKAVQELYATYMVQAIDANFRIPPSPLLTYQGTLIQPNRRRVKQDPATKWTLQAMLASMALCAAAVFILSQHEAFLPCSPCSIAGTMVLLAGSEMASRKMVPQGSEWNTGVEMWQGWLFSLGWWGEKGQRRFGVDVGRADRSKGS